MGQAPGILRQGRRGDGTPVNVDLNEYLVGKTIRAVETGALTEEGFAVTKLTFADGDALLIVPQPVERAVAAQTGVVLADRFTFLPQTARRIWTPGQRGF